MEPEPLEDVHALVLAAGRSTRIASIADGLPKPLMDMGGKPVILGNLEWLARAGIRTVWVNLHYRADTIRSALHDGSQIGLAINYSFEPELLGTAGAWKRLANEWDDISLVVYGDNVIRFDLAPLVSAHRAAGKLATLAVFDPAERPHTGIAGGRVEISGDGLIVAFAEGSPEASHARLVNAGVYVLDSALLRTIPDGFQDFARDVFPRLVSERELRGHLIEDGGFCLGVDTPESYLRACEMVHTGAVVLQ